MNFFDRLLKLVFSTAITFVISAVVMSMFLPKGLSIRQLPEFYKLYQSRNQNADAFKFLESLKNEEQMNSLLTEMRQGQILPQTSVQASASIATQQTTPEAVIDPAELERIDKMNISNELKQQLKVAYAQVGSIPKSPAPETAVVAVAPTQEAAEPTRQLSSVTKDEVKERASFEIALRDLHSELAVRHQKPNN